MDGSQLGRPTPCRRNATSPQADQGEGRGALEQLKKIIFFLRLARPASLISVDLALQDDWLDVTFAQLARVKDVWAACLPSAEFPEC
ncbi:hypothetical protein ElyMa_001063300 [Elysia marginata]|uniref:Uncharacterized protein n=1 Tax=Elysia marginata TaxID=1093978 RepID=A0AAV4HTR5_9GAST|nr:hypothetical protein ElyMa_001063300 [Elysia marginata]